MREKVTFFPFSNGSNRLINQNHVAALFERFVLNRDFTLAMETMYILSNIQTLVTFL